MECLEFINSAVFDRKKPSTVLLQKICYYSFTLMLNLAHKAAGIKPLPPNFSENYKEVCGF